MKRFLLILAVTLLCALTVAAQVKVENVGGQVGFVYGSVTHGGVSYAPMGFGVAGFATLSLGKLVKGQPITVRPEVSLLMGSEEKNLVKQERTAINVNVFGIYDIPMKGKLPIAPYVGVGGGLTMLSANVILSGTEKSVTKINATVLGGGKYNINPKMAAGLELRYGLGSGFDALMVGATFTYSLAK